MSSMSTQQWPLKCHMFAGNRMSNGWTGTKEHIDMQCRGSWTMGACRALIFSSLTGDILRMWPEWVSARSCRSYCSGETLGGGKRKQRDLTSGESSITIVAHNRCNGKRWCLNFGVALKTCWLGLKLLRTETSGIIWNPISYNLLIHSENQC